MMGLALVKFNLKSLVVDWSILSVALTLIKSTYGLGATILKVLVVGIKYAHDGSGSVFC